MSRLRPIKYRCPDCGAEPSKRCLNKKRPGVTKTDGYHEARRRVARGQEPEPPAKDASAQSGSALAQLLREFCAPLRFTAVERELADQLEQLLVADGVDYEREHELTTADRVDFFVHGRVAVEVKTAGSYNTVLRQLARYAVRPSVDAVLLVTTRHDHQRMPASLAGVPVVVHWIPFCA